MIMPKFTFLFMLLGFLVSCKSNYQSLKYNSPAEARQDQKPTQENTPPKKVDILAKCKSLSDSDRSSMMDQITISRVQEITEAENLSKEDYLAMTKVKAQLVELRNMDLTALNLLDSAHKFVGIWSLYYGYTYLEDENGTESPAITLRAGPAASSIPGHSIKPPLDLHYVFTKDLSNPTSINLAVYLQKESLEDFCDRSEFFRNNTYTTKLISATVQTHVSQ